MIDIPSGEAPTAAARHKGSRRRVIRPWTTLPRLAGRRPLSR
jgi:hypothetical protein